eukprot:CAMPEP_0202443502 /NCGR_PEP_ID=MMETSP1360-20130828/2733_1 /ASSEMBLY_ACC=CAM_ASM_000848 /TAXON_ID=515479 /ORGANISM="Licmophora paradoxa, Strain CCMP2313" /LENGTH=295 /DNA_ID=CAMNT_0049059191 /DNA_START=76 /DNA_END=963 /DNA_ORIENTATION=-
MSDQCEEQEMEAEALAAIFDTAFEILKDSQPFQWSVKLLPVDCAGDEEEEESHNHVAIKLLADIPLDYPETSLPNLSIKITKGLTDEHRLKLEQMAQEEALNNEGMPAIFAICELLRDWLSDNNRKGLDDASMHAQMLRKQEEAQQKKKLAEREFESQKKDEEMTQTELEEQAVRKRRAEGTPCNQENFEKWKVAFEEEMAEQEAMREAESAAGTKKSKEKKEDKSGRITGFMHFSGKAGIMNLEDIERAAQEAENAPIDPNELDVDEELFDLEDDEDLDDLDFDDDDDEEDLDI